MNITKLIVLILSSVKTVNSNAILILMMISGTVTAQTSVGYINVTGYVRDNTCTLDSGSTSPTIRLPDISIRDITAEGSLMASKVELPIVLRNCGADVTSVTISTSGKAHNQNQILFDNIIPVSSGGATGLGLFVSDSSGDWFLGPGGSNEQIVLAPSVDNKLIFYANYYAVTRNVTPGNFTAVVNMEFRYH